MGLGLGLVPEGLGIGLGLGLVPEGYSRAEQRRLELLEEVSTNLLAPEVRTVSSGTRALGLGLGLRVRVKDRDR